MPILDDWSLTIEVDDVLRGQGADPSAIRSRNQRLVQAAQRALDEAIPILSPRVLYERFPIKELRHEQLHLLDDHHLEGQLLSQHLGAATEVVLALCTIGEALETHSSEISKDDFVYGLALDGLGSAGVEALANEVCAFFEDQAQEIGLHTSIPLSPGMLGWPVEQGQRQIFEILDPFKIGVQLTSSMVMIPKKSLTFVLGMGIEMAESVRACDFCSLKETCRYQDHYA